MLKDAHIGLKVDVDTLARHPRGRAAARRALEASTASEATFYFSVGPDHTGRALRRVFRKGFAQKVARTSVLKHYGLKTLMYGVLLPGPDIGRKAAPTCARCATPASKWGCTPTITCAGRTAWRGADAAWTRVEFERGLRAFERVFGFLPQSHAAAGWQINAHAPRARTRIRLALCERYPRRRARSCRCCGGGPSPCPQIPTTLPTFDELLGRDGIDESSDRGCACSICRGGSAPQRCRCSLCMPSSKGCCLRDAFESLLVKWRDAGAASRAWRPSTRSRHSGPLPARAVIQGEIPGDRACWRFRLRAQAAHEAECASRRSRTRARRSTYLGLSAARRGAVVRDAVAAAAVQYRTRGAMRRFRARC